MSFLTRGLFHNTVAPRASVSEDLQSIRQGFDFVGRIVRAVADRVAHAMVGTAPAGRRWAEACPPKR